MLRYVDLTARQHGDAGDQTHREAAVSALFDLLAAILPTMILLQGRGCIGLAGTILQHGMLGLYLRGHTRQYYRRLGE